MKGHKLRETLKLIGPEWYMHLLSKASPGWTSPGNNKIYRLQSAPPQKPTTPALLPGLSFPLFPLESSGACVASDVVPSGSQPILFLQKGRGRGGDTDRNFDTESQATIFPVYFIFVWLLYTLCHHSDFLNREGDCNTFYRGGNRGPGSGWLIQSHTASESQRQKKTSV